MRSARGLHIDVPPKSAQQIVDGRLDLTRPSVPSPGLPTRGADGRAAREAGEDGWRVRGFYRPSVFAENSVVRMADVWPKFVLHSGPPSWRWHSLSADLGRRRPGAQEDGRRAGGDEETGPTAVPLCSGGEK